MAGGIIDGLLAGSTPGGAVEVDGHRDIGSKLPLNFFPEASGISKEGRENLVPYADHTFNALGIHQCVGQHAARLQAASLLEQLVPRIKSIGLASAIERHYNNTLRGWDSVPLRLTLA